MAEEVTTPMTRRIDSLIVRAIVTIYDADGKPVGEAMTEEMKIFRASVPDVWAAIDRAVKTGD